MTPEAAAMTPLRDPFPPEDWRSHVPSLCDGMDAPWLLIDPGPDGPRPRYAVIDLNDEGRTLRRFVHLSDALAASEQSEPVVKASLFVPLYRGRDGHRGHVAGLYPADRIFSACDIKALRVVADRWAAFLAGR